MRNTILTLFFLSFIPTSVFAQRIPIKVTVQDWQCYDPPFNAFGGPARKLSASKTSPSPPRATSTSATGMEGVGVFMPIKPSRRTERSRTGRLKRTK